MKGTYGAVPQRRCENATFIFRNLMHFVAAVVARRAAHKYVDGYYSRLAALRKRSENFRGVDINTVVMRLRPSETTQRNTPESGANLYDVTRRTFVRTR